MYLNTKSLSAGYYQLQVVLDDGAMRTIPLTLKYRSDLIRVMLEGWDRTKGEHKVRPYGNDGLGRGESCIRPVWKRRSG